MKNKQIRQGDVQFVPLTDENYLAIACDSSGGIGDKIHDSLRLDPKISGYYAAFVPLIELLSTGARPVSLVDTLSVEYEPTGRKIIDGIHKVMEELGISTDMLIGSTEDNIQTTMTTIGITAIGTIDIDRLDQRYIKKGQSLYTIGLPKVGQEFFDQEILGGQGETLSATIFKELLNIDTIRYMRPVGSKGIAYEIDSLANEFRLGFEYEKELGADIKKSAGPGTCVLVAIEDTQIHSIESKKNQIPVLRLGIFKEDTCD